MESLLVQIRGSKREVAAAVTLRLRWKRKVETANFSRSKKGAQAELDLQHEGAEIWQQTEPVITAHQALLRAFMQETGRFPTVEELNGKDTSKGR
jgi:hypothetical protein